MSAMNDNQRKILLFAVGGLALVGMVILAQRFVDWSRQQECLASGRRDCVSFPAPR